VKNENKSGGDKGDEKAKKENRKWRINEGKAWRRNEAMNRRKPGSISKAKAKAAMRKCIGVKAKENGKWRLGGENIASVAAKK
jgi:hypothetical protein